MDDLVGNVDSVSEGVVFVALLALLILHQVLTFALRRFSDWYDHRKGNGLQGTLKSLQRAIESLESKVADNPPYPQCHYAPGHFDQVEETHRLVKEIHQYDAFDHVSENHRMLKEVHALQKTHDTAMTSGRFGCRIHGDHLRTIQRLDDKLNEGKTI